MGRLIDVDEVKKRYPIMENDFGMVINESLHKELEAISKAYMVAILDKIRAEITDWQTDIHDNEYDSEIHDFIFERIYEIFDEYKAESEVNDNDT